VLQRCSYEPSKKEYSPLPDFAAGIQDTTGELARNVSPASNVISVTASRSLSPLTCLLSRPGYPGGFDRLRKRSTYGYHESRRRYI
jgi:hypothetical protein